MTEGPILPNLVKFAIPLFFTGVLQMFFNAADTMVVGRFAGPGSMAAIGATTSLYHLFCNLFVGLSMGANVMVARYYGARDREKVEETVHTAVSVSVLGGMVLALVGVVFSPFLLRIMSTPADVIDKSILYMRIIFLSQPIALLYNFGAAILRAYGDTRRPLNYLLFAGVVNVFANLFFVIVLHMDVAGVAIATVLSNAICAFLVVRNLRKNTDMVHLSWRKISINGRRLGEIVRIGVPAGLQTTLFSFSNIIIQSSINSFGTAVIAGNTAGVNIESVMNMANSALSQTNLSAVSQNYGAGKKDRVFSVAKTSAALSVSCGAVTGAVTILWGRIILGFFSSDPAVIDGGMYRLIFLGASYWAFNYEEIVVSTSRGLGRSFTPMLVSIFTICGARLLWIFTAFRAWHSLSVLFCCYPISWILTGILQSVILLRAVKYGKIFPEN